ncbi:MAG: glycine zipper domain-containing protein [Candidatus Methylacidiphilales bacterium]|nr:glycine zipper domain-containing protein [Candidatus Methylacidiphilales bacterium]
MENPSLPPVPPPPAHSPSPKPSDKTPWIIGGVIGLGVAVLGFLLLLLVGGLVFFFVTRSPGPVAVSSANANPPAAIPQPQSQPVSGTPLAAPTFEAWQKALEQVGSTEVPAPPVEGSAPGLWDKWFSLPSERTIAADFSRSLPAGWSLEGFDTVAWAAKPDGLQVTYRVRLRGNSTLLAVPVVSLLPDKDASGPLRKWTPLLIGAPGLPAGLGYATTEARPVIQAGEVRELYWTVRRLIKTGGRWSAGEADPIVYLRNNAYESRLLALPGRRHVLLRTEAEIQAAAAQEAESRRLASDRWIDIQSRVAAFRSQAMSDVPSAAADTRGRSGTGTPTKTGIGVLSGAAVGGGIGAAAGDGEGAAIGAGAGALLGGIIAYNVGRSDEKRAAAARNSARQQAINSANARTKAYEAQLCQEAENELKAAAGAHNARLVAVP